LGELGGDRRDLPRRAARGDDHVVGDARFAFERDRDDVLRLIVVEAGEDGGEEGARVGGLAGGFGIAGSGRRDLRWCHRDSMCS
jgi:hypothetical protein